MSTQCLALGHYTATASIFVLLIPLEEVLITLCVQSYVLVSANVLGENVNANSRHQWIIGEILAYLDGFDITQATSFTPGPHFIELVINDNLSFNDYYHGNSAFIANQNQECHFICH